MRLDASWARLFGWLLVVGWLGPSWSGVAESQPQVALTSAHYQIEAAYDPTIHHLEGQVTISAIWNGAEPLDALYVFLPPNTLSRLDPREPAAYADLRYAKGIDIKSNYKSREFSSPTEFQCGAGALIAGVALKGIVVKVK
jgi:hypothetical protein